MNSKKIVIVGDWKWAFYEEAFAYGFEKNNWTVLKFKNSCDNDSAINIRKPFSHFHQVKSFNESLLEFLQETTPDVVFFYRCAALLPSTLKKIKEHLKDIAIVLYHNDNPFLSDIKSRIKFCNFLSCIKFCDILYVYRPQNLLEARKYTKNVKLLMPYYYSKTDLCNINSVANKKYDIIYIGHYEKDGREDLISMLYHSGIPIHIFGPHWDQIFRAHNWPGECCHGPIRDREEYRKTLESSHLSLVFHSKHNKDVYTRRNFEIPASGSLMVSPRSAELENIFKNNESVIYYSTNDEAVERIKYYLERKDLIREYTVNSFNAVLEHSETYRAKQIIDDLAILKKI